MSGPLQDVKVADFTWVWVGPLTTSYLAVHGAQVIHIESSMYPDVTRTVPPFKDNIQGVNRAGPFNEVNCGKYGITLNLRHPKGRELAVRLIQWSDIVVENFRPGVIDRLGLGYSNIVKVRSDIIMMSMSMFGATGPHADVRGYGNVLASLSGHNYLTGWPDRDAAGTWGAYCDHIAPRFGAALLIAALIYRRQTGKGVYIDLSQLETALHLLAPWLLDYFMNGNIAERQGNYNPCHAPHAVYRCKGDDRWCVITVTCDAEWDSFCRVLGEPSWAREQRFSTAAGRKKNESELDRQIESWTMEHTPEQVMHILQNAGAPAGIVSNAQDLVDDPQLNHRHHYWSLDHQEIGKHIYDAPGFRLSGSPAKPRMAAPCLGEHNEFVYTRILGLTDEEFVECLSDGVFE